MDFNTYLSQNVILTENVDRLPKEIVAYINDNLKQLCLDYIKMKDNGSVPATLSEFRNLVSDILKLPNNQVTGFCDYIITAEAMKFVIKHS